MYDAESDVAVDVTGDAQSGFQSDVRGKEHSAEACSDADIASRLWAWLGVDPAQR